LGVHKDALEDIYLVESFHGTGRCHIIGCLNSRDRMEFGDGNVVEAHFSAEHNLACETLTVPVKENFNRIVRGMRRNGFESSCHSPNRSPVNREDFIAWLEVGQGRRGARSDSQELGSSFRRVFKFNA
jgi:hypothetical protein